MPFSANIRIQLKGSKDLLHLNPKSTVVLSYVFFDMCIFSLILCNFIKIGNQES